MGEPLRTRTFLWVREPVFLIAGLNVCLHLLAIDKYGYHRDELYFLDCARYLDFGFVDHPPLLEVVITLGRMSMDDLKKSFEDVTLIATITHPYAIFYENDIPVYVCRRPRVPIYQL